jgi:transcriptional regulator with XRE-family HTH domain
MKGRSLIAGNIRRIRVAIGVSQERLAHDSGIDRAYLGGIERQTENPTIDLLDRVAETLDVPLSELFAEHEPKQSKAQGLRPGRRASSIKKRKST